MKTIQDRVQELNEALTASEYKRMRKLKLKMIKKIQDEIDKLDKVWVKQQEKGDS